MRKVGAIRALGWTTLVALLGVVYGMALTGILQ